MEVVHNIAFHLYIPWMRAGPENRYDIVIVSCKNQDSPFHHPLYCSIFCCSTLQPKFDKRPKILRQARIFSPSSLQWRFRLEMSERKCSNHEDSEVLWNQDLSANNHSICLDTAVNVQISLWWNALCMGWFQYRDTLISILWSIPEGSTASYCMDWVHYL